MSEPTHRTRKGRAKVGQRYGKDREIEAHCKAIRAMLKGIYFYPPIFRGVKRSERKDGQINGEAKKMVSR